MGIKNLSKFLKKHNIGEKLHVSHLKYKKIAIDTPMFFYKFKACTPDWLGCFLNLVVFLRSWDIHPVFVFEGTAPPEKAATREERRQQRQRVVDKTDLIEHDLNLYCSSGTITPFLQGVWDSLQLKKKRPLVAKSIVKTPITLIGFAEQIKDEIAKRRKYEVSITSEDTDDLKELLNQLCVPYIASVGEAETDCASLFYTGAVDYVVSEDTDVLAYLPDRDNERALKGSEDLKAITSFDTCSQTFHQISKKKMLQVLGLTASEFLDFCIMCGTDYNKNVFRVGVEKAYKYITTYHNIEHVPLDTTILNHEKVRSMFRIECDFSLGLQAKWCRTPCKVVVKSELENFFLFHNVGYINIGDVLTALCDALIVFVDS